MNPYPVISLKAEDRLYQEDMGTKDKYWCQVPHDNRHWLFKQVRLISPELGLAGEHWAEKIASELGKLLGLEVAEVELAQVEQVRGSLSRNICSNSNEELVHGNEILAGHLQGYDKSLKRRQYLHTWSNILAAIRAKCSGQSCAEILRCFSGYMVLDAWIGNGDRHHENWALLRQIQSSGTLYTLCPSFDHASSLGRELGDERRRLLLKTGIDKYLRHPKARGAVYWSESDAHPLPLAELVRRGGRDHQDWFKPWLTKLHSLSEDDWCTVVDRVPDTWMSGPAKEFALAMLVGNRSELLS